MRPVGAAALCTAAASAAARRHTPAAADPERPRPNWDRGHSCPQQTCLPGTRAMPASPTERRLTSRRVVGLLAHNAGRQPGRDVRWQQRRRLPPAHVSTGLAASVVAWKATTRRLVSRRSDVGGTSSCPGPRTLLSAANLPGQHRWHAVEAPAVPGVVRGRTWSRGRRCAAALPPERRRYNGAATHPPGTADTLVRR